MDFVSYIGEFQQFPRLGLERMEYLAELLGNPQDKLRVIHIAGTNGKGSLCAYLDAVLTAAGYRVGKYSSPELERVNERITVSGKEIGTGDLEALAAEIKPFVDSVGARLGDAPSRFEISTAVALLYFARQKCDYVVLETGLGGRLDATNICKKPLVSVIMPVALDHQEYLGDTVIRIAGEKAGIIKDGVPVVCAPQTREALAVIEGVCREKGSPLFVTDERAVVSCGIEGFHERIAYKAWKNVRVGLAGWHQAVNAAVALDAAGVLRGQHGIRIPDEAVVHGIGSAQHKGRMEVFRHSPLLLFDGAHNTQGGRALACSLRRYCPGRKMTVAMAVMRDKDTGGIVGELRDAAKRFIALEVPDNPRALGAEALLERMRAAGVQDALALTMEQVLSMREDVVVCGSLYLYASFSRCIRNPTPMN